MPSARGQALLEGIKDAGLSCPPHNIVVVGVERTEILASLLWQPVVTFKSLIVD